MQNVDQNKQDAEPTYFSCRRPSMSTIIVDTLTGKSTATTITIGSTPVVSKRKPLTIRCEGKIRQVFNKD